MSTPPLALQLAHVADLVAAVRGGTSLTAALPRVPAPVRPGVQAIAFHALRWLGSATVLARPLVQRQPPPWTEALLHVALTLLWPPAHADGSDRGEAADAAPGATAPSYPPHVVVDQAVEAARQRAPQGTGFVNAVLRRVLRELDARVADALTVPLARWNHPDWWIERLRRDWPDAWEAILDADNRHPPMTLRVNARRTDTAAALARLAAAGLHGTPGVGEVLHLHAPAPVHAIPGFADGELSVQDAAAQRAAPLVLAGLPAGARVLDACAAPGGKTAHLLELADLELVAIDRDPTRLARVEETLARLGLPAGAGRVSLLAADAGAPEGWWDGRPFDAILLDAPCTASGIVRRHPDVRWLRRPGDIAALAREQDRLLEALWPLLAPGGHLVYATCSVFRDEGERRIDAFLQRHPDASQPARPASPGHLLPLPDNGRSPQPRAGDVPPGAMPAGDGFFLARLHRSSTTTRADPALHAPAHAHADPAPRRAEGRRRSRGGPGAAAVRGRRGRGGRCAGGG